MCTMSMFSTIVASEPLELEFQMIVRCHVDAREPKPGPQKEQQIFLTPKPSL